MADLDPDFSDRRDGVFQSRLFECLPRLHTLARRLETDGIAADDLSQ